MLKAVITIAVIIISLAINPHAGQSNDYVGLSVGMLLPRGSQLTDRSNASASLTYDLIGTAISICAGHQFGIGLRAEEELFYKRAVTDTFTYSGTSSTIDSTAWTIGAMSNLYYDWYHNLDVMADKAFSPYLMAGVGFANVNMSEGSVNSVKVWNKDNDTSFAYQIGIGSGIKIANDFILDVSYRYFDTSNIKIDQIKTNFSNHNILFGIRYLFSQ